MNEIRKTGRAGPDSSVARPRTNKYLELQFFKINYRFEAGEPILSSRTTFENSSPVSSQLLGSAEHSARGSEELVSVHNLIALGGEQVVSPQNPRMAGTADLYEESRLHELNLELRDALYSVFSAESVNFSSLLTWNRRVNRAG